MENMTREQWLIIQQFSCAVMALNSIFCEDEYTQAETDVIVKGLSEKISPFAVDDAIDILKEVQQIHDKNKG